ncbi:MAG: hypothetical protein ISQ43_03095 [Flavobacteriaceae bacterium]|nr:hypothetical protein [Flavobacteriaceae bacterium]
MQKIFLVLTFFLLTSNLFSQSEKDIDVKPKAQKEELKENSEKKDFLNLNEYKIFYLNGDYEIVDTSLTINKYYKFNFLRKDQFELLSFANSGHTYNKLSYDLIKESKLPDVGALAKHFQYFEIEDIGYYEVATPFTEIMAKSTFEQGQILDFLVSVNLSPFYNFTIAHKGYKSLGKYQNTRLRGNQFRFSSNLKSKKELTNWKFHITSQNIFNQENGGLTPDDIYFFEQAPDYFVLDNSGNQILLDDGSYEMIYYDGYLDRSRLNGSLLSESSMYSKRFFSDLRHKIIYNKDEDIDVLTLAYQFTHEYKKLEYNDNFKASFFGEFIDVDLIEDQSRFIKQENKLLALLNLNNLGELSFSLSNVSWLNSFKLYEELTNEIPFEIEPNQQMLSATYNRYLGNYNFNLSTTKSFKNEFLKNQSSIKIIGEPLKNLKFILSGNIIENSPNFNYIFYRSAYKNYNWYNDNSKNIKVSNAYLSLSLKELINISGEYSQIENYTFFKETTNQLNGEIDRMRIVSVDQRNSRINYLRVKLKSNIGINKFNLINTAMYQKTDQELNEINDQLTLNVPEWIVRSTMMFSTNVFNNSLYIQTGLTFNYFTKYFADYYNPLISEFVTQNYKQIGEYPRFDFFFNAKIQQTRVYISVEHLNSSFTGYDYYSDPFNPYRDMSVRLGLVWNFFQ